MCCIPPNFIFSFPLCKAHEVEKNWLQLKRFQPIPAKKLIFPKFRVSPNWNWDCQIYTNQNPTLNNLFCPHSISYHPTTCICIYGTPKQLSHSILPSVKTTHQYSLFPSADPPYKLYITKISFFCRYMYMHTHRKRA